MFRRMADGRINGIAMQISGLGTRHEACHRHDRAPVRAGKLHHSTAIAMDHRATIALRAARTSAGWTKAAADAPGTASMSKLKLSESDTMLIGFACRMTAIHFRHWGKNLEMAARFHALAERYEKSIDGDAMASLDLTRLLQHDR
jgi:hypothetical protein